MSRTRAAVGTLILLQALAGCAPRAPRLVVGAPPSGLDALLAARPLAPDGNIRADELGRTPGASYHLVQVRHGETLHRHATHDLAVFVLRGRGTLVLGSARVALAAGDAAVVPRGEVHRFVNEGGDDAIALVVFTPPLDAPDTVPAEDR